MRILALVLLSCFSLPSCTSTSLPTGEKGYLVTEHEEDGSVRKQYLTKKYDLDDGVLRFTDADGKARKLSGSFGIDALGQ